jgi:hypothetical protein
MYEDRSHHKRIMRIVTTAVMLVIFVIGAPTLITVVQEFAQSQNAAGDLADVYQVQQLSIGGADTYAPNEQALTDDEYSMAIRPTSGAEFSYLVNATQTHYVSAEKLSDGKIMMTSDQHRFPVTCAAYTPSCVAMVSTDPALRSEAPQWTTTN